MNEIKKYIIYDETSGFIFFKRKSLLPFDPLPEGQILLEVDDLPRKNTIVDVSTGEIVYAADIPYTLSSSSVPADGITEVTIGGLPPNTRMVCEGMEMTVIADKEVQLTFDTAGFHILQFFNVCYKDTEVSIEATSL